MHFSEATPKAVGWTDTVSSSSTCRLPDHSLWHLLPGVLPAQCCLGGHELGAGIQMRNHSVGRPVGEVIYRDCSGSLPSKVWKTGGQKGWPEGWGAAVDEASCLRLGRAWQRHGERVGCTPSRQESPSQVGRGLWKSLVQGWASGPHLEPLAGILSSGSSLEACPTLASHLHSSGYHLDGSLVPA